MGKANWVKEFRDLLFRIALVRARLNELRNARFHCSCGWIDWRIKDLERELQQLQNELKKVLQCRVVSSVFNNYLLRRSPKH